MSESQSALASPFEVYSSDFAKHQQHTLDFFSFHSPSDILAPHPDLFELELDSSLAAFDEVQLQLLTVDSSDAYSFLRSDTPTCGPPSTITASSESAYSSLSSHSESFYNYPHSPPASSDYSFLEMEFRKFGVDTVSDYGAATNNNVLPTTVDPHSFGTLPPTPPRSPELAASKQFSHRGSFSDYSPSSSSSDYYSQLGFGTGMGQSTVAPSNTLPNALALAPSARRAADSEEKGDPRKKYKCSACPRAFARAYNLKTHVATHDPNRLKPHVCPHHSCSRSFSRKHDLGRHLVSIHRDDSLCSSHHSDSPKKSIGVEKGPRGWCDSCGKGWVGRGKECNCNDIK